MKKWTEQWLRRFLLLWICAVMVVSSVAVPSRATEGTDPIQETVSAQTEEVPSEPAEEPTAELSEEDSQVDLLADDGVTTVLAASDFQGATHAISETQTAAILAQVKAQHGDIDAFMFCGDYSQEWTESSSIEGYNRLRNVLNNTLGYTIEDQYHIQGNHDPYTATWTPSLGFEKEDYSVFCLNEDDYNWAGECTEEKVKKLADRLEEWLDTQTVGEKPIFVLSHVPLHYSTRSRDLGDAQYAKHLVDVLNVAGQRGLNIIFLYGHNHGGSYDHYLGGATNFITKGDELWICNTGSTLLPPVERTINFTYMNAGFLGYYSGADADGDGVAEVDDALTMSVFEISGDDVTVYRYDAAGKHAVKLRAGSWWNAKESTYGHTLNKDTYGTPQTVRGGSVAVNLPTSITEGTLGAGANASLSVDVREGCTYSWKSSAPEVAAVYEDENGSATLYAGKAGTAKITVTESSAKLRSAGENSTSFYVEVANTKGVAVQKGEVIYRLTHKLTDGKRYIIADTSTSGLANTLTAPVSGMGLTNTAGVPVYGYPGALPYIQGAADKDYNVWLFQQTGDSVGHLVSACTDYANPWRLAVLQDEKTLWVTTKTEKGEDHEWGGKILSTKWQWNTCLLTDETSVTTNPGENLWLGFQPNPAEGEGNWQIATSTGWGALKSTYLYEEVPLQYTLDISGKQGAVDLNAPAEAETGTAIVKSWTTGKVEYIPVTLDMLSVDADTAGTFEDVTVTYEGLTICADFTLTVGADNQIASSGKYYYRLADTLELGKTYLILNRNTKGMGYAMKSNGYNQNVVGAEILVGLDAAGIPCVLSGTLENPNPFEWHHTNRVGDVQYGYSWLEQSAYTNVYLNFEGTETDDGILAGAWNILSVYNPRMHTEQSDENLKGITTLGGGWVNEPGSMRNIMCSGNYFYCCSNANRRWGREVYIYEKVEMTEITCTPLGTNGKVSTGAAGGEQTGTSVKITYPDGTAETVPVSVDMLYFSDGKQLTQSDLADPIRITGLTLKYQGITVSGDYILDVQGTDETNYPKFPNPGSVRVDKELDTGEFVFDETGVARIDLSATGVPMNAKLDILIAVDTSSSVGTNYMENGESRLEAIRMAIDDLVDVLSRPNPDGSIPDINMAISQFNDYTYFTSPNTFLGADDRGVAHVPFGDRGIDGKYNGLVQDYIGIHQMQNFNSGILQPRGGTNYDVAFQDAYQIVSARKAAYPDRKQIVIFMTDGICFQYNYLSYRQGAADSSAWKNWLLGGMSEEDQNTYIPTDAKDFYNAEGRHWMAEAIKGSPDSTHKVIWNEARDSGTALNTGYDVYQVYDRQKHLKSVVGLDASIYSIGFGIHVDGHENELVGKQILSKIASDPTMYYSADETEQLRKAFSDIGHSVRKAASDAYMMDRMGEKFDLQMGAVKNSQGTVETVSPSITVKTYELYKTSEVGRTVDGVRVTQAMVGTRKSAAPNGILETVTFNAAGTEAYSDKLEGNILQDGVICAKYFWYNAKQEDVNITVSGREVSLPPETFYWNVGDITEQETVLSYYVYLENSMGEDDVGVSDGIYETNAYADLYYQNYKNTACVQHTVSPTLPWNAAAVSYAFYLVDEAGNIIVNDVTGETGSFVNKIAVTRPVSRDMNLNTDSTAASATIVASDLLLDGYELYDPQASYTVHSNSGSNTGGHWEVGGQTGTTYVTGYGGAPTTASQPATDTGNFNNTTVWFAVKYAVQAIPDTVVIDYGIPVDIDVLGNDQFPKTVTVSGLDKDICTHTGLVSGVGHITLADGAEAPVLAQKVEDTFGTAELLEKDDGKQVIRYSLHTENGMQMNTQEVFSYVVPYHYVKMKDGVKTEENRLYYSTVTVIPATSIYYEDDFLTYKVFDFESDALIEDFTDSRYSNNQWTRPETPDATQGQDRPGKYSFPEVDANNIYGFDGSYTDQPAYSMDSAMKVTVDSDAYATAEFDFWGTGFDIISLTSGETGVIMAKVYEKAGYDAYLADPASVKKPAPVKALMVDTYYGYAYGDNDRDGDNEWYVDKTAQNGLYQVPVLKVGLTDANGVPKYGHYTAIITASYADFLDNRDPGDGTGSYDFYLDAIRIYDPANDGKDNPVIEGAYLADGEGWPEYFELRNLIISRNTFDSLNDPADEVGGIVFIDGKAALGEDNASAADPDGDEEVTQVVVAGKRYAISDYINFGPNNELYLAPGQAVAFKLDITEKTLSAIHLAMKSVGGTAKITVYNAQDSKKTSVTPVTVGTATDLYYDITALNGKTVVIKNTGEQGDGILSVTNVKVTYTQAHTDSLNNSFVTVSPMVVKTALLSMKPMATSKPTEPETTEPAPTEPAPTEPAPTEPTPTEPVPTEPAPTEPVPTDPSATEPKVPDSTKPQTPESTDPQTPETESADEELVPETTVPAGAPDAAKPTDQPEDTEETLPEQTAPALPAKPKKAELAWGLIGIGCVLAAVVLILGVVLFRNRRRDET